MGKQTRIKKQAHMSIHNDAQVLTYGVFREYVKFLDASPRTIKTYAGNIRQFLKWLGAKHIRQPERADVLAYRDELRESMSAATVQAYITALRLFFRWTAQAGLYPNIADHIKGAKIAPGHKRDYLTAEQARAILDTIDRETAAGRRDFAIMALMMTGGLRDIEISRANVEDLRSRGAATVLYLQGKGRDDRAEYVKIPAETETAIREYLQIRQGQREPLFVSMSNRNRGKRLTPRSISGIVKRRLQAAGYDSDRLTAHSLRHTAVTLALMGGRPIEEAQQFARHSNIQTTLVYAHHLDADANQCAETIASEIFRNA